jgi:hypothetical protein
MKKLPLILTLTCAVLMTLAVIPVFGQYSLSPDTTAKAPQDTTATPVDSAKTDSTQQDLDAAPRKVNENDIPAADEVVPEAKNVPTTGVVAQANTWLKRLLFRGKLDATEIGAYAQYQLTEWGEKVGSYGNVQARLTIYYLGSSEWQGRDAEWLQAVFQTVEGEPTTVEYDLIVPSASEIKQVYRTFYRVDGGELQSITLGTGGDQPDFDAADQPTDEGTDRIRLYSGAYDVEKSRGTAINGGQVVLYHSKSVLPLGLVRLGYGDEALTLIGTGSDAAARFDAPPPAGSTSGE